MVPTLGLIAADLFVVVAGHLQGASGRDFHTTVWITNPGAHRTAVRATFLERHPLKAPSPLIAIDIGPGETKELPDLPAQFRRIGVVGAMRFQSEEPIAVSARIFATDTVGAGLNAISAYEGLERGDEGVIPGVTYDSNRLFRQTTYVVETSGRPVGVFVRLRDGTGRELNHLSFLLEPYEHRSLPIAELARGTSVIQGGSISVRATGGSGRVCGVGLQIPSRSGDGYFVHMTIRRVDHRWSLGRGESAIYLLTALALIAAIVDHFRNRKKGTSNYAE
jgi:hypothetical protein